MTRVRLSVREHRRRSPARRFQPNRGCRYSWTVSPCNVRIESDNTRGVQTNNNKTHSLSAGPALRCFGSRLTEPTDKRRAREAARVSACRSPECAPASAPLSPPCCRPLPASPAHCACAVTVSALSSFCTKMHRVRFYQVSWWSLISEFIQMGPMKQALRRKLPVEAFRHF